MYKFGCVHLVSEINGECDVYTAAAHTNPCIFSSFSLVGIWKCMGISEMLHFYWLLYLSAKSVLREMFGPSAEVSYKRVRLPSQIDGHSTSS